MENGPFADDFPNKTSIYNGFSIAMLNYQRVTMFQVMGGSTVWPLDPLEPAVRGSLIQSSFHQWVFQ